jgi:aminodeoxyfutalosine synthase
MQPRGERALGGGGAPGAPTFDVDGRLAQVWRAKELQDRVGGFRAFAPLARTLSAAGPTTGYADIKQVALARTVVRNVPSIQVDWPLYGPKLAQVALTTGADDVDGVAAADPGTLGPRRSAFEEIRNNIRAAGLEAFERNGRFDVTTA